jgi:class 3 adenylate cyclase
MFCDLVGSTALSARLDPEDMREIIGTYHRCCADKITKAGGFVAQYLGDGVLAYFGYPEAHEDDPERAVRAGLTLVDAVSRLQAGYNTALQARIGIATGLVVVGDLISDDARERGVVGETPNLAARLQGLAEPGQVVISHGTRRLTGGLFEYRDLGRLALKGLTEAAQVWQVVGASTVESRFEAQHETNLAPLVGREEELELLMRRWRQAASGEGRVVLLSGEPGIGKSRLIAALEAQVEPSRHVRLRYFCSPQRQESALYPFMAQLERAAGFLRDDDAEAKFAKLELLLSRGTDRWEEIGLIAGQLGVPTSDRYRPPELSAQKRKERTINALLAQLEGLAAEQPVLAIFEDAHWIDPTSLELLALAIGRVSLSAVLLVITARPEFQPPWADHAHVTRINLARLPPSQGRALVQQIAGCKTLPEEVLRQIISRADGVPLFVEELTKSVIESGLMRESDGCYFLDSPLPPLAIPTSLHASLNARLDRLSPVRELAQVGAVLGREFSYEQLRAAAEMSDAELTAALDRLAHSELIFCRGTPPDATYIFRHALLRDAAHDSLLRTQRQVLHRRVALVLEGQFADFAAGQPELLAQHCSEGGLGEKAAAYWLKAAQKALGQAATAEAITHLTRGLAEIAALPTNPALRQSEINLQITLGNALIASRGHSAPGVATAFERARTLIERAHGLGDPPGERAATLCSHVRPVGDQLRRRKR